MAADELKPCPFCGALLSDHSPWGFRHCVRGCYLDGMMVKVGLADAWNRRANAVDVVAVMTLIDEYATDLVAARSSAPGVATRWSASAKARREGIRRLLGEGNLHNGG